MSYIVSLKKLSKLLITNYSLLNIVLVTGCFDLLHQAHKDFLKAAKAQGDILVLGLETDKRISQLKGKKRPINNWEKRAENLARLKIADYIFPLPESFYKPQAHLKLLHLIKPKILAVSQSTPHLAEKKRLSAQVKAKIYLFPHNPKYSTSKILP